MSPDVTELERIDDEHDEARRRLLVVGAVTAGVLAVLSFGA